MCSSLLCVAAIVLGVKYDTRPLPGGGTEYIIQLEPLALESLRSGTEIYSDIPPSVRDLRSFRIALLSEKLAQADDAAPRFGLPSAQHGASPAEKPSPPARSDPVTPHGASFAPNPFTPAPPSIFAPPQMQLGTGPTEPLKPFLGPAAQKTDQAPGTRKPGQAVGENPAPPPPSPGLRPGQEGKPSPSGLKDAPQTEARQPSKVRSPSVEAAAPEPAPPPASLGLTLSLAATTVGSFSGMVFFGWVAWDYRKRYRSLLRRLGGPDVESEPEPADMDSDDLPPPEEY